MGTIVIVLLSGFGWREGDLFKSIPSALGIVVTAAVGIIAWMYRTANQRLAVVDAIASNIFSILRISLSLFVVQNLILRYRDKVVVRSDTYFISREEYNVMSINPNDIGFLRQDAIKRINGFYITLRAYRDRALSLEGRFDRRSFENGIVNENDITEYKSLICIIIYYAFLCIENGRIALYELMDNREFRDESMFIAMAQDLRAYTFLLEEASQEQAIRSYLRHRLRERIHLRSDQQPENGGNRRPDPKEDYLFPGYAGGFARMKKYIRDLNDPDYVEDLSHLFGADIVRLFGNNYARELSSSDTTPTRDDVALPEGSKSALIRT